MSETIFDKILRKEIPAEIVYEDESAISFKDISPQAPVHVLVIPKVKVAGFADFESRSNEEVGALFKAAAITARKLGLADDGYRIVVNQGRNGQQTVDYIHIHILGGRPMNWPPG